MPHQSAVGLLLYSTPHPNMPYYSVMQHPGIRKICGWRRIFVVKLTAALRALSRTVGRQRAQPQRPHHGCWVAMERILEFLNLPLESNFLHDENMCK